MRDLHAPTCWATQLLHRQISVNVEEEGEKSQLVASLWCKPMIVPPPPPRQTPPKTYQHPHYVRPQLGKTVGSSSPVCLGLVGRRTGPLITFHNVGVFCVQLDQSGARLESKAHKQGPDQPQ